MPKTAMIKARTEPELKSEVEAIFHQLGLNTSEAVNLFYSAVRRANGLPFDLVLPNDETVKALDSAREGKGLTKYDSREDMFNDLGI